MGEAFATVTQLSVAGEASLCRMCYLTVLHIQKANEDIDARTRTVRDKVSSTHAFFFKLQMSEWSLEPTATLSASGGSISSQKES